MVFFRAARSVEISWIEHHGGNFACVAGAGQRIGADYNEVDGFSFCPERCRCVASGQDGDAPRCVSIRSAFSFSYTSLLQGELRSFASTGTEQLTLSILPRSG